MKQTYQSFIIKTNQFLSKWIYLDRTEIIILSQIGLIRPYHYIYLYESFQSWGIQTSDQARRISLSEGSRNGSSNLLRPRRPFSTARFPLWVSLHSFWSSTFDGFVTFLKFFATMNCKFSDISMDALSTFRRSADYYTRHVERLVRYWEKRVAHFQVRFFYIILY